MKSDVGQLPAILLTETSAAVPAVIAARGPHPGRRFRAANRGDPQRIDRVGLGPLQSLLGKAPRAQGIQYRDCIGLLQQSDK